MPVDRGTVGSAVRVGPRGNRDVLPIMVDRVACTGRGICASILTEQVSLDEWGYPVVHNRFVDAELGEIAVRLCPARALSLGVAP